jgi:hypothetical protein
MDRWSNLLSAMDDHQGQAAWAQSAGALIALLVALGIGATQLALARLDRRERIASYLAGAIGAVIHAELAILEAEVALGAMQEVSKLRLQMDESLHNLASADAALASLPIASAPSAETVKGILACQRAVRAVNGRLQGFLGSNAATLMATFESHLKEATTARLLIDKEHRRLLGRGALSN